MTTALRASGVLATLNELGVLDASDVHVAWRLGALSGEAREECLLALALAVRSVRAGSVMLDLAAVPSSVRAESGEELSWPPLASWLAVLEDSPLVGDSGTAAPLRREGDLLWLDAYWRQERFVASELLERAAWSPVVDVAALRPVLDRLWPVDDDQRRAAAVCALSSVAVLGGGPGTGKTTTVARLLVALESVSGPLRIAVAAPTGKAAARLGESLKEAKGLSADELERLGALTSQTLHRLLGVRRGREPWFHRGNRLPYDLVVVDEASMVSLSMFAKLLDALRPDARLLLVGDPNQLVSVEAGAVLLDLMDGSGGRTASRLETLSSLGVVGDPGVPDSPGARLRDGMARLTTPHRFEGQGAIDRLAEAIQRGNADDVLALLRSGTDEIEFIEVADDEQIPADLLRPVLLPAATAVVKAALDGDGPAALAALDGHRLLCAHRHGNRGVSDWERQVRTWLLREGLIAPRRDGRYVGEPLVVTANDYDNKLWNGDTGVIVADDLAVFATGAEPMVVPLGRLGAVRPMHAMTVHRSQGSQYSEVTFLLPLATSPLATRETLYTAVTRAVNRVRVIGSEHAARACVAQQVQRASGLRQRLG